jgi:hypothetical protein
MEPTAQIQSNQNLPTKNRQTHSKVLPTFEMLVLIKHGTSEEFLMFQGRD